MRKTAALLLLALMSSGCRNRNERVTSIDVTSPLQHKRLLRGFGSIYTGWRATNRVFAVALDRPPITDTATFLEMSFRAPLEDLGPARQLRVTVRANGIDACGETIQDAEWHLLDCHIPEKALKKEPVEIEVESDRSFRDVWTTGEERALYVASLALKEYEATEEYRLAQVRNSREGYAKLAGVIQQLGTEKAHELTDSFYRLPVWRHYSYQGIPTTRNPFDLWMIQQIIFETKPEFIIETGTGTGASALYCSAVLEGVQNGARILTVDGEVGRHAAAQAHPLWARHVRFLQGGATDAAIVKTVTEQVKGHRVMVMLSWDSSANLLAALRAYAPLVTKGCYVIVERAPLDGEHSPAGTNAVDQFLAEGGDRDFDRDGSREAVLWTSSPGGWLERK